MRTNARETRDTENSTTTPPKKKQRKSVKYMIEERREKWLKRKKKKLFKLSAVSLFGYAMCRYLINSIQRCLEIVNFVFDKLRGIKHMNTLELIACLVLSTKNQRN